MSKTTTNHLKNVFGVTCIGIAAAAIGVKGHFSGTIPGGDLMYLIQVISVIVLGFSWHSSQKYSGISWWRFAVMIVCCLAAGANVGTWIQAAFEEMGICQGSGWSAIPDQDWLGSFFSLSGKGANCSGNAGTQLVWQALGLTSVLYSSFAFAGFLAHKKGIKLFWMASLFQCAFWILSFSYWFTRMGWTSHESFDLIYIRGGLVVFVLKTCFDVQGIIEKSESGDRDVVSHSLTMVLNFLNLFIRVITLLAKMAANGKKKKK